MGFLDDALDIILEAKDIRYLRDRYDFRALRDLRFDILLREVSIFLKVDVFERRPLGLGNELFPRNGPP